MIITTETGSKYQIDLSTKTWELLYSDESIDRPFPLRTKSGTFYRIVGEIEIGNALIMPCPPLVEGAAGRLITTSPIAKIEVCTRDGVGEP